MKRICLSLVVLLLLCTMLASCTEPHTHEWGEWQVTQESSCQSKGERRRECSCGASGTEILPLAPHTFEYGTCTVCGAADTSVEPDDPSGPDLDWYE